jgi:CheY-like chemotaxis protein
MHDLAETPTRRRVHGYSGPRRTILLADDDPSHLGLLQNVLQPLDFILLPAHDGRSSLELASHHLPDLALLDISLPDMTGWDVVRALRAASNGDRSAAGATWGDRSAAEEIPRSAAGATWGERHPKIAMVSANAYEYSPGGGGGPLHDAFLVKPIDIDLLLECVGSLLQLEWLYDAPVTPAVATANPLDIPPEQCLHHIGALYELGRIGHVRGIEAKLREMEAEHPANGPFAAHLRGFISNFDLKRYMTVLESMKKHG